jgi:benzoylformate decarboxylase
MAIMTGGEALMEIFRREGVENIFGLPGSTELEFMDVLQDTPDIKYILCLHENIAVGMAEGYSRTSGKVGVVNLHTCAGLSSSLAMLLNAYLGGVPIIVTAGQQDTRLLLGEPDMTGDLVGMASQFTKWSAEISHAADIPIAIRRAFKVATQPPTGPVFISLPSDVLANSLDFEYVPGAPAFTRIRPDQQAIGTAAALLAEAQTPAIVVGHGVTRNEALDEVVKLAELTGARVYQRWMGDVNFPTSHPQYVGDLNVTTPAAGEELQSVDVLIAVGEPLLPQPFYLPKPIIGANTKIIQIDDNPWEIAKNLPVAAGIIGHIKVSLAELNDCLQDSMTKKAQEAARSRAADIDGETEKMNQDFLEKARREREQVPIAVSRLMQEIRDALKPGTLIVDDSVSAGAIVRRTMRFSEPMSYESVRGGGSIGWGMSASLGAKLAAPDRPVVALCADGGAIWSIQALWTAAHYNLPVTFVILANTAYNVVKLMKHIAMGEKAKGRYLGLDFNEPRIDFCQLAQAMGVPGQRVERPEELSDVLKSTLAADKLNLIEVRTAGSFREVRNFLVS